MLDTDGIVSCREDEQTLRRDIACATGDCHAGSPIRNDFGRKESAIGSIQTPQGAKLELKVGFEPTTCGLRNRCSTAELLQQNVLIDDRII